MKIHWRDILLYLGLLSSTSAALAQNDLSAPTRTYALGLEGSMQRSWQKMQDYSQTSNSLILHSSLLSLNEHFHFGPELGYVRTYSRDSGFIGVKSEDSTTSWEVGALGKWTLENIQTTTGTPFISVGTDLRHEKNPIGRSRIVGNRISAGYEYFIGSKVSLTNAIEWRKSWQKSTDRHGARETAKYSSAQASYALGLQVYL